ncbi:MAG: DedA family protein [Gammaproteobacteria bacterium]|nr:DedA family protein [Gammaproteobacteria bacterium]
MGSDDEPGSVMRRLYDWVLSWAATPYGAWALAVLALAESSVFPIPPDPLLLALCLGAPAASMRFAALTTAASVLGGVIGYGIGAGAWHLFDQFFFEHIPGVSPESFARVQGLYGRYDFWVIFLAGLTPLPYKVFTLSAGVFAINFPVFVLASCISRGLRFFVLGGLVYRWGSALRGAIDRHFNTFTWIFGILLVAGFAVVALLR